MNVPSRDDLRALLEAPAGPCVSIFMPTHRAGADTRQDPIRLKNLLREAADRLAGLGRRAAEARELLEPAQRLLEDELFWRHQGDGLAVFVAPGLFRHHRVPLALPELVVVADRFHLKPLLSLLTGDGRFYVLALSQKEVRLLQGTRTSVEAVELEHVPESLAAALKYDEPEKQLNVRSLPAGGRGPRAAVFHGHGTGSDDQKENLRHYFQQIDRGLREVLREERGPLVLAGVDYLLPIYRAVNTYPHLLPEGVHGSPEAKTPQELHARAWPVVEPYFRREQEAAAAAYRRLDGTGRASRDLREILPAARGGRVEVLFVAVGVQAWGTFDRASMAIHLSPEPRPGDEDLLNLAAVYALANGAAVYAVRPAEVPGGRSLAAVFRY